MFKTEISLRIVFSDDVSRAGAEQRSGWVQSDDRLDLADGEFCSSQTSRVSALKYLIFCGKRLKFLQIKNLINS